MRILIVSCILFSLYCPSLLAQQIIPTDRFGKLEVFKELEEPLLTILLFSDSSIGIDEATRSTAKNMALLGAQVIAIDSASYLQSLAKEEGECLYLGGEIVRFNQSILSSLKVKDYHAPILAGIGQGATIAYSIFNQTPNIFLGLITFDFQENLDSTIKLCKSEFITFDRTQANQQKLLPPKNNVVQPWYQLTTSSSLATKDSTDKSLKATISSLIKKIKKKRTTSNNKSLNLPMIKLLAKNNDRKTLVIFLSGDGGWASIDKDIALRLQEKGISVIGLDCLKYFWKKRTPTETAKALEDIFDKYQAQTKAKHLVLLGYSFGAEVLPLAFPMLSNEIKLHIKNLVLLNPGLTSNFEIKISDWIFTDNTPGEYDVKNAMSAIPSVQIACLYGQEDKENACIGSESSSVKVMPLPGDHHFDGDYSKLGNIIIDLVDEVNNKK